MQPFSKCNNGYRYFFLVLDIFRKYGWILIGKNKSAEAVALPLGNSEVTPVDDQRGCVQEFFNKHFKDVIGNG